MKLQNLLLPENEICTDEILYFRRENGSAKLSADGKTIEFSENDTVLFDTYFNGFSAVKWFKYTKIQKVCLNLSLSGKFRITLMNKTKSEDKVTTDIICTDEINCNISDGYSFDFSTKNQNGMYCFSLTCLSKSGKFSGGSYETSDNTIKPDYVKIALDICTYKREEYLLKNLKKIQTEFFDNPLSALCNRLEVFVSDNACTLDIQKLSTEKIHIFHNKNTGGSGGFTRGIIEIQKVRKNHNITHILLMDDDVVINPESLYRTFVLLSVLKDCFKDTFIGGGMLRIDMPHIQLESGAKWNKGTIISGKHNLDLSTVENCLYNEQEEEISYIGWWFCVFPAEVANEHNLPLPLFIKCDDIEYSLRNMKNVIMMNGICVWHEAFETKYSSSSYYYIQRNTLIDNAVQKIPYSRHDFIKNMSYLATHEIMFYRYKNAQLMIDASYDFLKGVDWLKNQNPSKLNSEIISKSYKFHELSELPIPFSEEEYKKSCAIPGDSGIKKIIRKIKMNGIFMPAKRKNNGVAIVPTFWANSQHFYRVKTALNYDAFSNKAFITQKNYRQILGMYLKIRKLSWYSMFKYNKAVKDYQQNGKELMSLDFWNKYLGLK